MAPRSEANKQRYLEFQERKRLKEEQAARDEAHRIATRRVNEGLWPIRDANRKAATEYRISLRRQHGKSYDRYVSYLKRAHDKKMSFYLTINDFKCLELSKCWYCGGVPSGFDRYNNNLGYIRSNIVPCCWICNIMKHQQDPKQFIKHIRKVYKWTR